MGEADRGRGEGECAGAAYGTIIVGLHDEPVTLLLALVGLTVIVRVVDPVTSAVGTGVAEKIRRAFGLPSEQPPGGSRRRAPSRRTARPADE